MGRVFRTLLNLYPGEGKKTLLFILLAFFWSVGSYGFQTLSEGLFLRHMGARALPGSYLITALGMMLMAGSLLYAFPRSSGFALFRTILFTSLLSELTLAFLHLQGVSAPWVWYLFKIVGWMVPIAINIGFWVFIDGYFSMESAKRCFCLLNSAIFLGDAFGGGLITFGLSTFRPFGLILIFISFLACTLALFAIIFRSEKALEVKTEPKRDLSAAKFSKTVFGSRFTILLMLFYFAMQLLMTTTEYTYMETFDLTFSESGSPEDLTPFLGKMAMIISLSNMLFGIFLYSRTISRFGVNNSILITPIFFFALFLFAIKNVAAFPIALSAFIAKEGLSYTFDDNNYLLLLSGVPPRVKNHVRATIESLLKPLSMLFAAAALFFAQSHSHIISFVLAIGAVIIALSVRALYPKALLKNLFEKNSTADKPETDWIFTLSKKEKTSIERTLLSHLRQGDEKMRLFALESLLKMKNQRLLPFLVNATPELSLRGKLLALDLFENSEWTAEPIVMSAIDRWKRMLPNATSQSLSNRYAFTAGNSLETGNT